MRMIKKKIGLTICGVDTARTIIALFFEEPVTSFPVEKISPIRPCSVIIPGEFFT